MKVRNCLIIEDNPADIEYINHFLEKLPFFYVSAIVKTYEDAVEILLSKKIDLIFLDIKLNNSDEITGLDILKTIADCPPTIITTNYPQYAVNSYDIGKSADYLLKPYVFDRFLLAINRALKVNINSSQIFDDTYIFLKMGRSYKKFNIDDIDYFEAYGIYLKVIANNSPYVINETISSMNEQLDSSKFIRIHKSYIVNIAKIVGFDHKNIFLKSKKVPIGVSYKNQLSGFLRLFEKT